MSSPQLFIVQEDEKEIRFKTTNSLLTDESSQIALDFQFQKQGEEEDEDEDEDDDEINNNVVSEKQDLVWFSTIAAEDLPSVCSSTKSPNRLPSLGQFDQVRLRDHDDEDEDGFATPISSDYKIPFTEECPPAPKKIRTPNSSSSSLSSSTRKRKSPSPTTTRARRPLHLDLSTEIEDMFPPTVRDDLGRKIKRACRRTEFLD